MFLSNRGRYENEESKVGHFIFLQLFSPLDLHLVFFYLYVTHYTGKIQKYKTIPEHQTNLISHQSSTHILWFGKPKLFSQSQVCFQKQNCHFSLMSSVGINAKLQRLVSIKMIYFCSRKKLLEYLLYLQQYREVVAQTV